MYLSMSEIDCIENVKCKGNPYFEIQVIFSLSHSFQKYPLLNSLTSESILQRNLQENMKNGMTKSISLCFRNPFKGGQNYRHANIYCYTNISIALD